MTAFEGSTENILSSQSNAENFPLDTGTTNPAQEINKDCFAKSDVITPSENIKDISTQFRDNKDAEQTEKELLQNELNQFSPVHHQMNGHIARSASETNLSTILRRSNSNIYFIPIQNENQKSYSVLTTDSCLMGCFDYGSHSINIGEGASLDSGVSLDSNPPSLPNKPKESIEKETYDGKEESYLSLVFQVFIPYIIAGVGTCGAGLVLDTLQYWDVFQNVSELFIVVPTLLGLKGNLEMTLASRLSTQANIGNLNTAKEAWKMGWGNMALKLAQASIMGLIAAGFAVVMDTINNAGKFDYQHALLLGCSCISTGAITTVVLGTITTTVVLVSHRCHINPDNIATPVAASLGDITTLGVLAYLSNELYHHIEWIAIPSAVIAIMLCLVPFWIICAKRNIYTEQLILTGWLPVIIAVAITSGGGFILEVAVKRYPGMAVFQPVINGIGGNLVAVQASRIATYFHQRSKLGTFPSDTNGMCISPCSAFFGKNNHSRTAKLLMALVIPGHLIFAYAIHGIKGGDTSLAKPVFLPIYLAATVLQVAILLYTAHLMILIMWRFKIDPDNSAIPLLTALGDLLGTGLLTVAFLLFSSITVQVIPSEVTSPTTITPFANFSVI